MSESNHIDNAGSCIATAQAISAPGKIRWMMRTPSAVSSDSGWRFYADEDDEDNVAHTTNMRVVDFNTIVDLEPVVALAYEQPVGSDFELVRLPDGRKALVDATTGAQVAVEGGEPAAANAESSAPAEPAAPTAFAAPVAEAEAADETSVPAAAPRAWDTPVEPAAQAPVTGGSVGASADQQSVQDAAVAASAAWLRPAVQATLASPQPATRAAMLSEFFGATVLVPSLNGTLASFAHGAATVIPVHTSRDGLLSWQQRLGVQGGVQVEAITGDELLRRAFDVQGVSAVVLDPMEAGVEIRPDDLQLQGFSRNGKLKSLVRSGDRAAVLEYLTSPGAFGVYLYRAQPGEAAFPLLVTRQGTGEREFALFSSALEVFRYQGDGSAAQVGLDWIRQHLAEDMYLCVDPGAAGGFIEFSPAELAAAGFRTA